MSSIYDEIYGSQYDNTDEMSFGLESFSIALEASELDEGSKNVFQKILDWFKSLPQKIANLGKRIQARAQLAFRAVKGLFKKAENDPDNASEYTAEAKQKVADLKEEIKKARDDIQGMKDGSLSSGDKDTDKLMAKSYRDTLKSKKKEYRAAKKDLRESRLADQIAANDARRAEKKAAKAAKESYSDYDPEWAAIESAFAVSNDPSLCAALESMQLNLDVDCTTAEEAYGYLDGISNEINRFNRDIQILKVAYEEYMDTQDKENFEAMTRSAVDHLQASHAALGLATESTDFGRDEIRQIHNFLVGAQAAAMEKVELLTIAEESYEDDDFDDFLDSDDSFLSGLVN